MDIKDLRGLVEAYQQVNAPEQLDEISQKTATKAYAERRTGEFEGDDSPERIEKTDKLEKRIKKKFGEKGLAHAEKAAEVKTFGRKDASGRRKQSPQPRIQTSNHENQKEFKTELRIRRDRRLRAARGEDTNEQFDIFDTILEFLYVEGYAETLEEAEWMMANLIDDEAIEIILGESALGTMAVLGGMAAGRAIHGKLQDAKAKKDYEEKKRTSDYLIMKDKTKNAIARDRAASGDTRKEEFEAWFDAILEARRADKEGYERGSAANPKRKDIPHGDPSQRSMLHSKLKRRADEMGRARRSSSAYKAGSRPPVSKKEKAFLQAADRTRQSVRNPNVPNTGKH